MMNLAIPRLESRVTYLKKSRFLLDFQAKNGKILRGYFLAATKVTDYING
jgi:hypothetical protein